MAEIAGTGPGQSQVLEGKNIKTMYSISQLTTYYISETQ